MPEWKKVKLHSDVVPPMRYKSTSVPMNDGKEVYAFGGLGTTPMNQIWCLDVEAHLWKPIAPRNRHIKEHNPPLPRLEHSMSDTGLDSFIVFGGRGEREATLQRGDSGILSSRKQKLEGEDTRELRYRKYSSCEYFNDVIEFNILERKWYNRSCYGQVPMRRAHTLTLVAKETIIPLTYEEDTFSDVELDEEIEAALGNPVKPKFRVEVNREMYAIGGATISRKGHELSIPDLWILNLDTYEWRKQPTSGNPPARINHTTTNIDNKLYVIGGLSATTIVQQGSKCIRDWGCPQMDVAILDTENYVWTTLQVDPFSQCPPPLVASHCAVLNPFDGNDFKDSKEILAQKNINTSHYFKEDSILIFGGKEETSWTSNIYRLGLGSSEHKASWSQLDPSTTLIPPVRYGHIGFVIPKDQEQLEREEAQRLLQELRGKKKKKYSEDEIAELEAKANKEPSKDKLVNTPALLIFGGSLLNGDPSFTSSSMYALEPDKIEQKVEEGSDDDDDDDDDDREEVIAEEEGYEEVPESNNFNTGVEEKRKNSHIEIIEQPNEIPIIYNRRSFSAPSKRNNGDEEFSLEKDFSHLFSSESRLSNIPSLEGGLSKEVCSWEYKSVKKTLQSRKANNTNRPMTTPTRLPTTIQSINSTSMKSSNRSSNNKSSERVRKSTNMKTKKKGAMLTLEEKISLKGATFGFTDLDYIKKRNMGSEIDYTNQSMFEPKLRKSIYERKAEFQRKWEKKRQLQKLHEQAQDRIFNTSTIAHGNPPAMLKTPLAPRVRKVKNANYSDAISELAPSTISTSSSLHYRWHVLSKRTPTVSTGK